MKLFHSAFFLVMTSLSRVFLWRNQNFCQLFEKIMKNIIDFNYGQDFGMVVHYCYQMALEFYWNHLNITVEFFCFFVFFPVILMNSQDFMIVYRCYVNGMVSHHYQSLLLSMNLEGSSGDWRGNLGKCWT